MVRLANMIMMGAMVAMKPILPLDAVKTALEAAYPREAQENPAHQL